MSVSFKNTPLVLLPGVLCDETVWSPVVERMPGHMILVPEYPVANQLGSLVRSVLDQAPERFDLAGHSMGGYIALEIMRVAPERVKRLALLSTSPFADSDESQENRMALVKKIRDGGFDEVANLMARVAIPKSAENAESLRKNFIEMAVRTGSDAFSEHQIAIAGRRDQTEILEGISRLCLLVCAEDDKITPISGQEAFEGSIPKTSAVRLKTGGHLITWTQPDLVASALKAWRTAE